MDLPQIRFDYVSPYSLQEYRVIANIDNENIKRFISVFVINKKTGDEISWVDLPTREQMLITSNIDDWILHYKVLEKEEYPASYGYDRDYVDWLNKELTEIRGILGDEKQTWVSRGLLPSGEK